MSYVGRTIIPAPHGQLEAIYVPADHALRAALVLHPHPLYGGTMHNKIVFQTAKALEAAGFVTLRFNFRGVGDSTGRHDGGRGARDDAHTTLDYLLAHQPAVREVLVAGFSFGAAVAVRFGCGDARVQRLIAIATPASWLDAEVLTQCRKPIAFIHGDRDDVAPLAALTKLLDGVDDHGRSVHVIRGAGHFFEDHLDQLALTVRELAA